MSVQHESILSCLRHWAEVVPEKLAFGILDGDGALTARLSYRELALRSLKVSEWLGQRVAAGERVALVLPTSIEFVLAYYGCLAAGVMPVPLSGPNRRSGVGHLRAILQDCDAKLCLCDGDRAGKLAAALQEAQVSVPVIAFGPELYDQCQPATPNLPDPAQTAFLQYTSGSTSQPKGVMVGHRNIMANSAMIASVLGHDHDSVQVNWMPLFHDMGLVNHVLQPVFNGNSSLLMEPALFVQRPRLWLEAITRYRVTSTGGPSFCYEHCVERIKVDHTEGLDLSSLKVAFNGAEPIKPQVMRRFEALFESRGFARTAWLPCYGLAEGTLIVSGIHHGQGYRLMEVSRSGLADGSAGPAVVAADAVELPSVGPAVPGLELLIVEPQTLLVQPPRKVGEIWAGGDSITQGYWCNREATAETFVMYEGKRYLRTGDLGFLDERHELYVTGRLKDLIVIDGKNHYPQDLELTAQSVDVLLRVNAGAAFSRVGEDGEKVVLVQEIATNDQGPWDSAQLLEIKNRIRAAVNREHAIAVDEVVFIGSNTIPKTTSGKIPRRQVKELYERRALKTIA